ncbi:MAG: hypothetical protein RL153_577 [Verrucomicrobiota bacterium]|jgi:hypothetical protein
MQVTVEVDSHVAETWRKMARHMGLELDAFVRSCVRSAGPRLLEHFSRATDNPALATKALVYRVNLAEEEQP